MTQDGGYAAGEDGGQPAGLGPERAVADGVDADMDAMQPPGADLARNPGGVQARCEQLGAGDDAVLPVASSSVLDVGRIATTRQRGRAFAPF